MHIFESLFVYAGSSSHTDVAVFTGSICTAPVVLSIVFCRKFQIDSADDRLSDLYHRRRFEID